MVDWARVRAQGYGVPAGRRPEECVDELSAMLRSPDPVVRDQQAFGTLTSWIGAGRLGADVLRALGDEMVTRFGDPEVQARTVAPLILDAIVSAGVFEPAWVPPFERWYVGEEDLRGHDPKLGWLHAVAHGADLLGALGLLPAVEPVEMLRLGIGRVLTPTPYVFRDLEDDRLGYALAATLTREDLTAADATDWLDPAVRALPADAVTGVPAEFGNTLRTLRVVHVLVAHGVRVGPATVQVPHRDRVLIRLADVFRAATPRFL